MSYAQGIKAENYFMSLLNQKGIPNLFIDDWYDFLVNNTHKVEVKSCQLVVSNGHKQLGIYQFSRKENRELQYTYDVWVCFIIQHENQFLIQGFTTAQKLNRQKYISVVKAEQLQLISFEDFIKIILKKNKRVKK